SILCSPTVAQVQEGLNAEMLNHSSQLHNLVDTVVVGAMAVQHATSHFKSDALLITPGDREDLILAAATGLGTNGQPKLAGIVLTGDLRPSVDILKVIQGM